MNMKKYLKRNKFYFMICVLLFSTAGIMSVFLASIVQKMVDTSVDKKYHPILSCYDLSSFVYYH